MGKSRIDKKIKTEKWQSLFTSHKWLIGMVKARSAATATGATTPTGTAAATTKTLGGEDWLGRPSQLDVKKHNQCYY